MLNIAEEFLLLTLDLDRGKLPSCESVAGLGLAGATIEELAILGHAKIVGGQLAPQPDQPADPILAGALRHLRRSSRSFDLKHCLQSLGRDMDLPHQIAMALVRRGALRVEKRTMLGIFSNEAYPAAGTSAGWSVRKRLRAFLTNDQAADERSLALAGLAQAVGILQPVFAPEEWKPLESRASRLLETRPICNAVRELRTEMDANAAAALILMA